MAREKNKKNKAANQHVEEQNPEAQERKRLKLLANSNKILSETPAKGLFTPLTPSKTVIKHHGKDILKKSQRKSRYLFSFSGLLAPISGGKIGELTDLGSKNPILYFEFPQGRMKLFGTIVYPKNRYLTLQFSRGGKNVMCEDCFDTMIVFSDACWVGKKDENPDEARLDFPEELYEERHCEFDFQGGAGAGAGATAMKSKDAKKVVTRSIEEESLSDSPIDDMEIESPDRLHNLKDMEHITPVRQSERTAGKRFKFAEASSGDDSAESVSDMSAEANDEAAKNDQNLGISGTAVDCEENQHSSVKTPLSSLLSSGVKESSRTSLVQATISTLFKKVVHKVVAQSSELTKENISRDGKAGVRSDKKKRKVNVVEVEDGIDEFPSTAEETDGSDDDWHA